MLNDEILAQLTEMFGDYIDQKRIAVAVQTCKHDLEACIEYLLNDETEPDTDSTVQQPQSTSTGAIKKAIPQQQQQSASTSEALSFASFLQKGSGNQIFGAIPQPQRSSKGNNGARRGGNEWPSNFAAVVDLINKGFRVMVLMRGAPGSGKSYLSRALIDKTLGNADYRNHIFGADDYFIVNGVYKYQPDRLEDAHRFNQNNVMAKARDGWSPIVVDNTNMKLWEMHAYVQIAAEHGYYLEVLEPVTHWRNSARALASRNVHGVPEPKIKTMLVNYERLKDATELYKQCKLEHALYLPTKIRHFPIVKEDLLENTDSSGSQVNLNSVPDAELKEWSNVDWEASNDAPSSPPNDLVNLSNVPTPKPPRQTPKHVFSAAAATANNSDSNEILAVQSDEPEWNWPTANEISWKPYDEESADFWTGTDQERQMDTAARMSPQPKRATDQSLPTNHSPFLLSNVTIPAEWRTPEVTPVKVNEKRNDQKKSEKKRIALVRHRRGCLNENTSFSEICNLYPQIPAQYLWDLFEKCNGDGDWTANLLLEEQKMYDFGNQGANSEVLQPTDGQNTLECDCNEPIAAQVPSGGYDTDRSTVSSPRNTMRKKDKIPPEDLQNTKKQLEAFVVLGKQHYSNHIQQIRAAKGIIRREELAQSTEQLEPSSSEDALKTEPEVLEVTLGVDLIKQLHSFFKDKHSNKSFSVDDLTAERTKVFMASETAEQLYLTFMDAMYSFREEEKLFTLKKDEQIAKQMDVKERYPTLFNQKLNNSDTPNLTDIIEMEYALSAYRNEMNGWTKQTPQDLASQMTRQKLAEMFPSIEEKVLVEILHAHDNKFHDTVNVLNNSIPEQLRSQIAREREDLLKRAEVDKQKPAPTPPPPPGLEQSISGEEAINLHLKTAEECRNLAQHHQDLKNECHEKARNAIQRGMAGVAEYYAQIARLHRTKIDMYNSKASNSIMEVHKLTLNNADVLDLHYLHSEEALRCLEIFLAEHAGRLRTRQQQFKELFIITGRGLHSADGIPIIKHRVKAMLRDLGLRFMELNPGFLKIKVFNNPDVLERLLLPQ